MKRFSIILLFIILLFSMLIMYLKITKQNTQINKLSNIVEKLKNDNHTLQENTIDSWSFERSKLNVDSIYDEENNKLDEKIIKNGLPLLIFRFSEVDCSDCVIEQIDLIRRFIDNKQINYTIVADYSNNRNLGLFKRANGITETVYNCKTMVPNEQRSPFFCVYFNDLISNVLFPDTDFPHLTEKYLEYVSNKYFNH